jgi:hypothetical protein
VVAQVGEAGRSPADLNVVGAVLENALLQLLSVLPAPRDTDCFYSDRYKL